MIPPRLVVLLAAFLFGLSFPSTAADPSKVLRVAIPSAETAFDPAVQSDQVSLSIAENIFEPMLQYDYLARPAKLIPNTLEHMPQVSADGTEYLFRIKRGIYFTPDPAFKGIKRELTAADYAYSLKRLFDPRWRSPWLFLLEGKIVGLDALRERALASGRFDYDEPVAGLEAVDRHTLRIRLKEPDYNLLYILAMPTTGALAREVVEAYGDDVGAHPVGTGPFVLKEWVRGSKVVLEANPDYRQEVFRATPSSDPWDRAVVQALQGRRLPNLGQIEVYVIEEAQPRWLAFLNREHDYLLQVPGAFVPMAIPDGKLAPNLARQGIRMYPEEEPITTYTFFNMEDPVVGGYTPEKVALRRAICLAYNDEEEIRLLRRNLAIPAQSPIPPGVAGYDPNFRSPTREYNPAKARALLDLFGYADRDGDGYRELPDGRPLTIEYASAPTQRDRQYDELWKKNMDAVGIRLAFRKAPLPELNKMAKLGRLQMMSYGWVADYPDGDNFFQLLYGGNVGRANYARFRLPEFDRLYEKARRMPDSPERTRLYQEMTRLMLVYAPWKLGVHQLQVQLLHPWVLGYKKHPIQITPWKYLELDLERRQGLR